MEREADIAIVGYGPVGQFIAGLLGRMGHRVVVFERFREIYRQPRAVHLDHEIMRLLQGNGLAEDAAAQMIPVREYRWFGADGDPLLTLSPEMPAKSAWEPDYLFFQPELEESLDRRACEHEGVTVHRGWVAEKLVNDSDGAILTLRRHEEDELGRTRPSDETASVSARWVIGADGANSFVREAAGIGREDLGFQERWLVVDVEPDDITALADLPIACQWCDPRRPTTHVQSGPRHRRWEFMLMPDETEEDFHDPARVWALLEPWFRPGDGRLVRSAVYEFRSMLAEGMRAGSVVLAGDAAHLTPPFLGQGLCAGLRDAANAAWKLDLVLRGLAADELLDTIETERQPQTRWLIEFAIELGKVLCELDPEAARRRDADLRGVQPPPPVEAPPLQEGVVRPSEPHGDPLAGTLGVQGTVTRGGRTGRFDDVVGAGWTLIAAGGDPLEGLDPNQRELLDALDATVASLDPAAPGGIADADGRLTDWLGRHGAHAALVRPDFYVFGSSGSPAELPALIDDLGARLALANRPLIKEH